MKELITRKLTADTKFTDQVYEGSNLAILIDIVSYMYQCLLYSLNKSAAEAMFSDTQIYENINRLCKFIGYNPKGCSPATVQFVLDKLHVDVYACREAVYYAAYGSSVAFPECCKCEYVAESVSHVEND